MLLPQFSSRTMFWWKTAIVTVFKGWTMIDVAGEAVKTGDIPYGKLGWMGAAYTVALQALSNALPGTKE